MRSNKHILFLLLTLLLSEYVFVQKPIITVQPTDQPTCEGKKVTFSVTSNAASFQWMESKDGVNFTPLTEGYLYTGSNTKDLTIKGVNSLYKNYSYKCILKDITGTDSETSNTAKITFTSTITPSEQSFEICEGKTQDLLATSTLLTNTFYEWTTPNGVTNPGNVHKFTASKPGKYMVNVFTPLNTNLVCNGDFELPLLTYSPPNYTNISGFPCWSNTAGGVVEVWQSLFMGVPAKSGKQFIEINASQAGTLITDKISLTQGTSLLISFAHRGRSGIDKMQVLIGLNTATNALCFDLGTYTTNNTDWVVYKTTYTIPANGDYNLRFISVSATGGNTTFGNFLDNVIVENAASLCAYISKEFTLKTIPLPTATISGDATVCKDATTPILTFTGSAGTTPYTFTYTINGGSNQTLVSTGNTATINIPTNISGNFIYKLIAVSESSTFGCTQNQTGTTTFKILPLSIGGTLSNGQTICTGTIPTALSLTGHVGTITKWQSCEAPNTTWTDITHTTASYTPSALTKTTKYRVEVKNDICTAVYSNEITIIVDEKSVGGTITSDQPICETATPAPVTLTGHTGQIKKWQFSVDPYTSWSDLTNTSTSYSPPKLTKTTKYRAVIKNGVCPEVYATPATITLKPVEKLNITCGLSSTTDVEFIWTDISDETTYDYTYSIDGGSPVVGQASSNATSVTIPVTGDGQSVEIKNLTPTGASCAQVESKICISKICPTPSTNQIADIPVCSGKPINIPTFTSPIMDAPTSYKWRVNYAGFSIGTSGTQSVPYVAATNSIPLSFTAPTTTSQIIATFSVNAIDATCTGKTMNFKVIVNPLPVLNITNDGPICSGERAIKLSENSGNATSWQWSNSSTGSLSSTTIYNPTISNAKNSEVVTVEATDVNSCKNTATTTLVVHALPNIVAGTPQNVCSGNPITLVGSGGVTYTWDNSVVNNVAFTPTDTKTYNLTGTDNNNCVNTAQVAIQVTKTPKINTVNQNICSGIPISISPVDNISGQIVPVGTNYTWTFNAPANILGANNQTTPINAPLTATLTNNTTTIQTVSYTVTAHNGTCTSDFFVNINLYPLTEFTPSARSKCINDSLFVKANSASVASLTWIGPNSFAPPVQTNDKEILVTKIASSSHQGPYIVEVIDLNGCKNTKTINVSINPLPIIDAGLDRPICMQEALTLKASGGKSYLWDKSVVDGVSFLLNTKTTFTVIGTDLNGCKNTDQVIIDVNPLPDFTLSVNEPCEKTSLIIKADLNPSNAAISSSDWKGPNNYTSNLPISTIPNISLKDSGNYTFTLKDNNLCTNTKSIQAKINPLDSIFFATITPKCTNDSSFLLPVPNIKGGSWSSSDNTSILDKTSGLFAPTKSKPDAQNKVEITYTTATVTPARKCPSSKTKDVFVNPIPDSAFYATKTTLCIDDTFHLIVKKPVNNAVYTWDLGNGGIIDKDSPFNYAYSKGGDFTIKLEATLANCKVSKKLVDYIHVVPKPTFVNFSQSENEIDFYFPEIRFTSYTNGTYFYWNFGDGTYSTLKNPIHIFPENPGEYMVELTASNMEQNACSVSIKHSIFMPEPLILFVPNTFTPNSDEFNNVFIPVFTSGFDPYSYSFYIYNRWGELLFESHDAKIGWDGTYGNKIIDSDTYVWKLEFKEKLKNNYHVKSGHVNIIK
jgi:gliding motility-associated-like protein